MRNKIAIAFLIYLLSTAYLAAHATPSIFYMTNVLLHVFGGGLLLLPGMRLFRLKGVIFFPCAAAGAYLAIHGALRGTEAVLVVHILAGLVAIACLFVLGLPPRFRKGLAATLAAGFLYYGAATLYQRARPNPHDRIRNSQTVPTSMEEEGAGPQSPFWPSSANTNLNTTIPSNFFMDSKLCGECHKDIYEQWNSSMHHFASFNNKFYAKSILHMQELSGTKGSKWCAGCHDHAVFFNGRFDKPIKDQIDTPEAQNGLGCVSCHSITQVNGSMGNGGFVIEYPPLHDLASSRNGLIRWLDRFLTFADPEPHRRTFLKPFMRLDSAEYCSTCHKVHLDAPVNQYRWLRGFNDYDNWQASGVSGQGARSFYYPAETSTCTKCHMPEVESKDPGNRNGFVHSHRFAAANTAVASVNHDKAQFDETARFLKSGFITVDIFAASPVETNPKELQMRRRATEGPQLMSTFAVGEESEQAGDVFLREVGKIAAPLGRTFTKFKPGSTIRLDVVVRTRGIGHFFPGGTVDAFDVWLELEAVDAKGQTFYHSGALNEDGSVEKGAHFYRSYLLDGNGGHINKRNAWQARSALYVRLIPPGAADVAHYLFTIPKNVEGPIYVEARLRHRKFAQSYVKYVEAPEIPILTLAAKGVTLHLDAGEINWHPVMNSQDRERWNDWGIGLLLQGDLKGAEYAFRKVIEADPTYSDGWLNLARALIQEGQIDAAKPILAKANQSLARTQFFKAMTEKADGDYDSALASLAKAAGQYPRDRVVLNQIGRLHFLKRDFNSAVAAFRRVLDVDPEDVQAHYNLMLAYRGLGQTALASREEILFRRFKADESSQSITAIPRQLDPEANNERQTIHDHESVPFGR